MNYKLLFLTLCIVVLVPTGLQGLPFDDQRANTIDDLYRNPLLSDYSLAMGLGSGVALKTNFGWTDNGLEDIQLGFGGLTTSGSLLVKGSTFWDFSGINQSSQLSMAQYSRASLELSLSTQWSLLGQVAFSSNFSTQHHHGGLGFTASYLTAMDGVPIGRLSFGFHELHGDNRFEQLDLNSPFLGPVVSYSHRFSLAHGVSLQPHLGLGLQRFAHPMIELGLQATLGPVVLRASWDHRFLGTSNTVQVPDVSLSFSLPESDSRGINGSISVFSGPSQSLGFGTLIGYRWPSGKDIGLKLFPGANEQTISLFPRFVLIEARDAAGTVLIDLRYDRTVEIAIGGLFSPLARDPAPALEEFTRKLEQIRRSHAGPLTILVYDESGGSRSYSIPDFEIAPVDRELDTNDFPGETIEENEAVPEETPQNMVSWSWDGSEKNISLDQPNSSLISVGQLSPSPQSWQLELVRNSTQRTVFQWLGDSQLLKVNIADVRPLLESLGPDEQYRLILRAVPMGKIIGQARVQFSPETAALEAPVPLNTSARLSNGSLTPPISFALDSNHQGGTVAVSDGTGNSVMRFQLNPGQSSWTWDGRGALEGLKDGWYQVNFELVEGEDRIADARFGIQVREGDQQFPVGPPQINTENSNEIEESIDPSQIRIENLSVDQTSGLWTITARVDNPRPEASPRLQLVPLEGQESAGDPITFEFARSLDIIVGPGGDLPWGIYRIEAGFIGDTSGARYTVFAPTTLDVRGPVLELAIESQGTRWSPNDNGTFDTLPISLVISPNTVIEAIEWFASFDGKVVDIGNSDDSLILDPIFWERNIAPETPEIEGKLEITARVAGNGGRRAELNIEIEVDTLAPQLTGVVEPLLLGTEVGKDHSIGITEPLGSGQIVVKQGSTAVRVLSLESGATTIDLGELWDHGLSPGTPIIIEIVLADLVGNTRSVIIDGIAGLQLGFLQREQGYLLGQLFFNPESTALNSENSVQRSNQETLDNIERYLNTADVVGTIFVLGGGNYYLDVPGEEENQRHEQLSLQRAARTVDILRSEVNLGSVDVVQGIIPWEENVYLSSNLVERWQNRRVDIYLRLPQE